MTAAIHPLAFLTGGVGAVIRAHDWSRSPLGAPESWPPSLRSVVGLMLGSKFPMFLAWGPELGMLYNDGYAEILGAKHPASLGAPFRQVWGEIWDDIGPLVDRALAGEATYFEDLELVVRRRGHDERAWFTFSYSPLHGGDGAISGMFCTVRETTSRVLAERRATAERERLAELFEQAPAFMALLRGPQHVFEFHNQPYHRLVGGRDLRGRTVAEALPEAVEQGFIDLLDRVYRSDEPYRATAARFLLQPAAGAEADERFLDFVYQPIRDAAGQVDGILVHGVDVTERHRMDAALTESEARLRAVADNLPVAVVYQLETDRDLGARRYTYVSGSSTRLLGIDADQAMADASVWFAGLDPNDLPRIVEAEREALARRGVLDIEVRFTRSDNGRVVRGRVVSHPRPAEGGRVLWDGLFLDVTEQREAQERERFLLALSDRLRDAKDAAAAIESATELLGRHLGLSRCAFAEIDEDRRVTRIARNWRASPDVENLAGLEAPLDVADPLLVGEARAGRTLVLNDIAADPRVLPSNVDRWLGLSVGAMILVPLTRAGRLRATLNVHSPRARRWTTAEIELVQAVAERAWDAVERALAEDALREETRTLETLNRVGSALAGELDLDRLLQMVTDAGVELTGAKFGAFFHNILDETGERLFLYTLSGAERSDFDKFGNVRATGVFGPTFRNEGVVRSEDILADPRYGWLGPHHGMPPGHLPVRSYLGVSVVSRSGAVLGGLLFGHPEPGRFTDRHERLMLGIAAQAAVAIDNARLFAETQRANDLLEQRVAERTLELEEAHDALRQSQKMEAVGQLTGGIAHDFNNMLAVVIGSLDLLGRRIDGSDPRARRYLDAAADGARRAATLTQRLLAFSRQQPLRPEPLDANKLVSGMSDLLRHSLGADVQVETVLAGGLWRTHADPNQLENAILNLAVNARDAMPGGGRLTVETQNAHLDDRYVGAHPGLLAGQYVLIAVTDSGSGMSPEVIAKAFDPFFTTKDVGKGTGLGLSQVYGFVKQSGGHVRIYSEPGQGTTVKIYLPRYHGAGAEADVTTAEEDLPLGEREEVVLVVEDEPGVRQFSVDALSELGYRVLEADGAAAALRLLDAHPEIALMFTDVVMPEVNGAKLAEEARRRRPDLPILFTTGYTRNAVVHNGVLDPGVELLGKPFTIEELAAKVRAALDSRLVESA